MGEIKIIFSIFIFSFAQNLFAQEMHPGWFATQKLLFVDTINAKNQTNWYVNQISSKININQAQQLDYYNLAICYSAKKQIDSMFYYLSICVHLSPQYNNLILTDTDFDFIWQNPRWGRLSHQIDSIYLTQYPDITNKELAVELYHIFLKDQHTRGLGLKKMDKNRINTDSENLKRVEEIIQQYGWPTYSMVGKISADGAFLVIQHSNITTQRKYFKQLFDAAKNNEASKESVALLTDRISVHLKGMQMFGTQVYQIKDSITGKPGKYKYFPIKNGAKVDSLRKEAGLIPLKQYYALFGIEYKPVAK